MTTPFPFVSGQVLTAAQLNDIQNLPISDKTASYTLIAGDETKRTMMNNASATTITVNNSIFTVGDVIQVANKGAGTCTITAGAGVTINTSGSLSLAQYGGGYLLALSASTFTFFNLGAGNLYGVATGGTSSSITVSGQAYTLLSFLSDSNLVVSKAGLFDVLLVGGGGASGSARSNYGTSGGGAAGGLLQQTVYLTAGTYTVDVGSGGAGAATNHVAAQGLPSSITGLSAPFAIFAGGGGAGASPYINGLQSTAGGSSGGAKNGGTSLAATVSGCGFAGGSGGSSGAYDGGGGGGGGSSAVGANGSGSTGGAGGAGTDIATFLGSGSAVVVAGGGGGGGTVLGANGTGTGSANSGGGAQGKSAASGSDGSAGYSGRIHVRFKV
jgi:hypothetical protein